MALLRENKIEILKNFRKKVKNFVLPSPSNSKIDFPYIRQYFLLSKPTNPHPAEVQPWVPGVWSWKPASESPDPQLQGSGGFDGWSEPASRLADSFESAVENEQTKFLA